MTTVSIADLKARLSSWLRAVQSGEDILVLNRNTPVARLVPVRPAEGLVVVRKPPDGGPPLGDLRLPPPLRLPVDVVDLLREDREGGR